MAATRPPVQWVSLSSPYPAGQHHVAEGPDQGADEEDGGVRRGGRACEAAVSPVEGLHGFERGGAGPPSGGRGHPLRRGGGAGIVRPAGGWQPSSGPNFNSEILSVVSRVGGGGGGQLAAYFRQQLLGRAEPE